MVKTSIEKIRKIHKLLPQLPSDFTDDHLKGILEIANFNDFEMLGTELGELVAEKNEAYGDSFMKSGEIMKILYPNGIKLEQYRDALGVVRIIDKLFRIATRKNAFGESPWKDISGYGIVGAVADSREASKK